MWSAYSAAPIRAGFAPRLSARSSIVLGQIEAAVRASNMKTYNNF